MAAKRALMVYRLNKAAFDYVIGEIHAKFMASKVRRTELYHKRFRAVCGVGYIPVLTASTEV